MGKHSMRTWMFSKDVRFLSNMMNSKDKLVGKIRWKLCLLLRSIGGWKLFVHVSEKWIGYSNTSQWINISTLIKKNITIKAIMETYTLNYRTIAYRDLHVHVYIWKVLCFYKLKGRYVNNLNIQLSQRTEGSKIVLFH